MPELVYRASDKLLTFSFYILFFLVPLLFTPWNFELFEFNKMMLTYGLAVVIVACWAIKCIIAGKLIFRRTLLFLPLLLFLLSQIISSLLSIDTHTSIWGYYTRSNGGLLSTTSYILLYYAFVSNFDKGKLYYALRYLLTAALIVSVWGILEHFGRSPSCLLLTGNFDASCWVQDVQNRVFATLGQPNWMAAFLVAVTPLSWSLVISKKQKEKGSIHFGLLPFALYFLPFTFFLSLLFTKSRSGLLGFAASFLVFWGITFLIHNSKFLIRPFVSLVTCYLLLVTIFGTPWTPSVTDILNPTPGTRHLTPESGTVLERGGTESGEIRKIVWKGAIDIWRAYPLFGSGVETFAYSYYNFRPVEHNLTSEWNFLYNKAHNEYLNFLANTGLIGLATYLALIFFSIIQISNFKFLISNKIPNPNFKNSRYSVEQLGQLEIRSISMALLAGFAGILVTNFFGFSVVPVALLFFLYPAMGVALNAKRDTQNEIALKSSLKNILSTFVVLLFAFYVLLRLAQFWYADTLFNQADKLIKSDEPARAAEKLEEAINLNSGEPNYYDKLAAAYSTLAATFAEENKTEDAQKALGAARTATDQAYAISPRNISLLKSRASTFNRLSSVDPSYMTFVLLTLERAAILAPTDPTINYNLAIAYYRAGQSREAIETLEKLNKMKPDYADSRFALAEIYTVEGQKDKAREELEYILKNIDPNNEPVKKLLNRL